MLSMNGKSIGGGTPPGAIPWEEKAAALVEKLNQWKAQQIQNTQPVPAGFIRQGTPEWFELRKHRITASIAATCLGLNPFDGRAKAWRIIKGTEPSAMNDHIYRGLVNEEPARRLYEARHGVQVAEAGFVVHPTLPWLGASPDGLVGGEGLLEIKCPQKLPESMPVYHRIQCQVQLACTGRQWCDYFAYCGPGRIFEARVVRDLVAEYDLLMGLWRFWNTYVVPDKEPPRTFHVKDDFEYIKE